MVMAVEDLHVYQIPHRAISIDSFFVAFDEHTIRLCMGNLRYCGGKGDIGFDADIKSLGFAVSYALAKARGVASQCNSVAVLTNHPEGESFISNLVKVR